jgi:transposase
MDIFVSNCAGLDVHKDFISVAHRVLDGRGRPQQTLHKVGTLTPDLHALTTWLQERGCTHVVMESTGVYWLPVYNILAEHLTVWVVNAAHVKQVPGRKTDLNDAAWLAQLLQHGLLRPSYIPPQEQRDLRDLVRLRQHEVDERSRLVNRLQKVLEDANIKLGCVVSDMQGVSAQAILAALLEGERRPAVLAELAKGRLRRKREQLAAALEGRLREHHCFLVAHLLEALEFQDEAIARLETEIAARLEQLPEYGQAVERLDSIPGVNRTTATVIVAEIGVNMEQFPSAKHLAAWAGMAPGNNETGGKQRAAGTRKGNRYLRRALAEAGQAAGRKRGSALRAKFWRIAGRRGKPKAVMAVGRTILEIAYHVIKEGTVYEERGEGEPTEQERERTAKRLLRRLKSLGYEVSIAGAAAAA